MAATAMSYSLGDRPPAIVLYAAVPATVVLNLRRIILVMGCVSCWKLCVISRAVSTQIFNMSVSKNFIVYLWWKFNL